MFELTRTGIVLFGLEIHWYGVLIALGVLGAVLLALKREKKLGLERDTTLNLALICVPVGVVCARIYYVLFNLDYFIAHPAQILDLRGGGLAVYGAVIGGAAAAYIYTRIKKIPFGAVADLVAPGLAFGQALGRWGNFFNQEAYGALVENPLLRFFPLATYIEGSGWHYATFFYESIWCALICICLLALEKRGRFRRRGDVFFSYLFLYALERSIVEGLRTDSLYIGSLRVSQLLSILALLILALLLARSRRGIFRPLLPVLLLLLGLGTVLAWPLFVRLGLAAAALLAAVKLYFAPEIPKV